MTTVYSFDVFDTILTRVFARPVDLFAALLEGENATGGYDSLGAMDPAGFARARAEAERRAREMATAAEITIEAIYEELGKALELAPGQRLALMQAEIDLEMRSVRPVPAMLAQIQQARTEGKRILFVSDMYLPAPVIQSMLENCGAYQAGDHLYLSNEAGATKARGGLFSQVLAQEGIEPEQLHHFGDNVCADVERAHALGIRATHLIATHLNRYERTVADATGLPSLARSLVAGASRLARLTCPYEDEHRRTIWEIGASVAGPILSGYVAWLLHDAHNRGLERIYFVSRDGQILLRIARVVCRKLEIPLDCRYLYGSRQAWHLPAAASVGEFEYDWVLSPTDFLSVAAVLRRVGLSPLHITVELREAGFGPDTWHRNLDEAERLRLKALIQSGRLDERILSQAAQRRRDTLPYLTHEGLLDVVPYAVVDIGWNGRLQRSLGNLLALGGQNRPVVGYYFGLRARVDPRPHDVLHAYMWDGAEASPYGEIGFQTRVLMEIFAAADHGGVARYEFDGGDPRPVLLAEKNEPPLEWGVPVQQEAIVRFVEALEAPALERLADPGWPATWARLLELFFYRPTLVEAKTYGRFPVGEDQNEAVQQPLAQPFTVRDAFRALRRGTAAHHHNEWRSASKVLTPWPIYVGVRLAEKLYESWAGRVG